MRGGAVIDQDQLAIKIADCVGSLPKASTIPSKRSPYSAPWRE